MLKYSGFIDNIYMPATPSTPATDFDYEKGILHLSGRSLENNAVHFFNPLINWVDEYIMHPRLQTTLHLNLEYLNTPSSKCLLTIIHKLKYLKDSGRSLTVIWEYDAEDEDMLQNGEVYSAMLQLPFEFIKGQEA